MNYNPDYQTVKSIHEFTLRNIQGEYVKLDKYKNHVCIIVNVASRCGLAKTTYKQLNELYEQYGEEKGLRILAFPCNQFGNKEPDPPKDIIWFALENKVRFDLFDKIDVNCDKACPLWKFLKHKIPGDKGNYIKWNFTKFIITKAGVPVERFEANVMPVELVKCLEKLW